MAKTKSGRHQINIEKELKKILNEFTDVTFEKKEKALNSASDYLSEKLALATPVDTGSTSKKWTRTDKYKGVRYVGNTNFRKNTTGNENYGKEVPITNMIEFSKNGKPFIRATFEREKDNLIEIMKGELNK